jgi:hypothetical protein
MFRLLLFLFENIATDPTVAKAAFAASIVLCCAAKIASNDPFEAVFDGNLPNEPQLVTDLKALLLDTEIERWQQSKGEGFAGCESRGAK